MIGVPLWDGLFKWTKATFCSSEPISMCRNFYFVNKYNLESATLLWFENLFQNKAISNLNRFKHCKWICDNLVWLNCYSFVLLSTIVTQQWKNWIGWSRTVVCGHRPKALAITWDVFFKNGPNPTSFLISFFSHDKYSTNAINDIRVDGVLGTQTQGGRMVGTDKSTELWWHPIILLIVNRNFV